MTCAAELRLPVPGQKPRPAGRVRGREPFERESVATATERLAEALPGGGELAWRAPGRANLIGEHTDYNDGFVLPVALDLATYIAGSRHPGSLRLRSLDQAGEVVVDLTTGQGPDSGWGRYVAGVVKAMLDDGVELAGFDGIVASDIPIGSGLSSSAALEVAVASAIAIHPLEPLRQALICRRAENIYVGVQTGIMDQLASAAAKKDHALLIDCRDNTIDPVPMPSGLEILVVDSGASRDLGSSAYNERRKECELAAEAMGLGSLRDADLERLEGARRDMPDGAYRRARHIVTENQRVLDAADALRRSDLEALGSLFERSYRSYADDFEASTPEIETLVSVAAATDGVVAARLTGGGWGGCTVNLVRGHQGGRAATGIAERYEAATGITARWWISSASGGVRPVATG